MSRPSRRAGVGNDRARSVPTSIERVEHKDPARAELLREHRPRRGLSVVLGDDAEETASPLGYRIGSSSGGPRVSWLYVFQPLTIGNGPLAVRFVTGISTFAHSELYVPITPITRASAG